MENNKNDRIKQIIKMMYVLHISIRPLSRGRTEPPAECDSAKISIAWKTEEVKENKGKMAKNEGGASRKSPSLV